LSVLLLDQAAAARAAELDAAAAVVRSRLAKAAPVQNANPLGSALEALLGAGAAVLTAWQQAIVAAVFELCLVGVMVIFELLGHRKVEETHAAVALSLVTPANTKADVLVPKPTTVRRRRPPRTKTRVSTPGLVSAFFRDHIQPAPEDRVEMKTLTRDIRAWGSRQGLDLPGINELLDDIAQLCQERSIEIEVREDQRVYCRGIQLVGATAAVVH
jgi:hypothetical protein